MTDASPSFGPARPPVKANRSDVRSGHLLCETHSVQKPLIDRGFDVTNSVPPGHQCGLGTDRFRTTAPADAYAASL